MDSMKIGTKSSRFHEWQNEDKFQFISSFVGSVIEFREKCGQRQRVVGTLDKCDHNSFNLSDTLINGDYFGDYVINDYEISKWRLRKYLPKDIPKLKPTNTRVSDDNNKYLIPNEFEAEEGDDDLLSKCVDEPYGSEEVVDLNEDDDVLCVNLNSLSQKASNDIIFINEIKVGFDRVIQNIKKSNSVGIAVFGEDVSRYGSIDLMAFATKYAIYIFDSNNRDIVNRLKPVLESEEPQKYMFGVRIPSDALYHLFGIELKAIDVRVWDYWLQKKDFVSPIKSSKPYLRSLETLLWLYLRVKAPKVYRNIDFKHISTKVENYIRIKTIFLRELFHIINRKLLFDAYMMNNRCLRSLRSAEGLEYIAVKSDDKELEIIENPILAIEETEQMLISLASNKQLNGFNGKEIIIESDEEIIIDSDEELDEIMVRLKQNL